MSKLTDEDRRYIQAEWRLTLAMRTHREAECELMDALNEVEEARRAKKKAEASQ